MSHITHIINMCDMTDLYMCNRCVSLRAHPNESRRTYKGVMAHAWMSHGTHMHESWRMSHVTHMKESCRTYEWVMSHIWMSHGTRMIESCHIYKWVMAHIYMSHVKTIWGSHGAHMNESCHTYESVMSHTYGSRHTHQWVMALIWMNHVTHMNESCHTYERGVPLECISDVTRINESRHTCEWVMSHARVMRMRVSSGWGDVTHMNQSSLVWMCHVTHINKSCQTYECVRMIRCSKSCMYTSNNMYICVYVYI